MRCLSPNLERLRLAVVEAVASSAAGTDIVAADIAVEVGIVAERIASVADIVAVLGIVAASALAPVLVLVLPLSRSSNRYC